MSQILSSAYRELARLLIEGRCFISPAELQGSLWGRSVAGANTAQEQTLQDCALLLDESDLTDAIKHAVMGLQEMINKELSDDSVTVTVLLPVDEEPLADRLKALVDWGQGFLSGFGLVRQFSQLPKEVLDILEDLSAIVQLEISIAPEDEDGSEGDYAELVEFLRVVPLSVATEIKIRSAEKPSVH